MTERSETLTAASAPSHAHEGSYVDWPAVFSGAVVASAIALVFAAFGTALGLSLVSPYDGDGSAVAAIIAVALWMLWTTISSFMAGGYIAGRMRRRVDAVNADEVSVRDGIHGLTVWGAAVLIGAVALGSGADTAIQAAADAAGAVAAVAAETGAVATTETGAAAQSTADTDALAEAARLYAVFSAFTVAATLFIAAASAYWAAGLGGRHRDESRVFARFGHWM